MNPSALPPGAPNAADEGWLPPADVDEYQLIRPLGRGGAGLVFLADDTLLERPVSVKFLRVLDPESLSRFVVEARAAARVQHPNVATLYRVGHLENRPYLVSEFVRGKGLNELECPVPWRTVVGLAKDLASGLSAAHRCGVLHRDIKPANAILTHEGQVKLLDFGLAKLVDPRPARTSGEGDRQTAWFGPPSVPGVTDPNALVGTPHYMAPECWRGEEATTRSDLYSLGVLLYELCSGAPPHHETSFFDLPQVVPNQRALTLREVAPELPPGLCAIVDRCLELEPLRRFASADELLAALEELTAAERRGAVPEGNPYRGLQPFYEEHRHLFFGRGRDISAVIERLRTQPFVVLTGDSGVGKSSLCFAGVLPAVTEGALRDGRSWSSARWVPGRSPVAALCACLASALGCEEAALEQLVRDQPEALGRELRARLGRDRGLLLYVDQLEELVTLSSPEGATAIGAVLGPVAAGIPGLALLATARSDFLTRLAAVPRLGEHLPRALLLLRSLTAQELREAVVGPVRAAGGRFETEAMVDTLVRAASQTEGGLPLVQFALAELWNARNPITGVISSASLDAIGGVSGALARHAEAVLTSLLPEQRRAAREILMRLVTPQGTRARRSETDLAGSTPVRRAALDALVRGRLLVVHELDGSTVYELAHEALLTGSATIAGWVGEEASTQELRERLGSAAAEWARLGFSADLLWTHRHMLEAASLSEHGLTQREREFLTASRRKVNRARAVRGGAAGLALLLIVGVYALVSAGLKRERKEEVAAELARARTALEIAREAQARSEALREEAYARFDRKERAAGERQWKQALAQQAAVDQAYLEADDHHERAIVLSGGAPALRTAYADLLFERAVAAERAHRPDFAAVFLQRMRLHDLDRRGEHHWSALARVELVTDPAGAVVSVERYDSTQGRWSLEAVEGGGTSPLRLSLPPGSYVLTVRHPQRLPVRYPIALGRGEEQKVSVTLPTPRQVPAGFVYVPEGRFLYGSGDDETIREFFNAVPIHPVRTSGYLIARNETTFADWIAYLDALPPAERRRRTPRSSSRGLHGYLALTKGRAGWRLEVNSAGRTYAANQGERIRFLGRTRRAEQDWLRFPVSGISWDDARTYVKWLSDTGRVRGARLCTELEWERAARGADERIFPHGAQLEPDDANFDQTYGKDPLAFGPDEVGAHPASRSPFEVDDLTGNVWEWVQSSLEPGKPVARGGSFYFAGTSCRVTNRETPERTFRDVAVGLRVCASASF